MYRLQFCLTFPSQSPETIPPYRPYLCQSAGVLMRSAAQYEGHCGGHPQKQLAQSLAHSLSGQRGSSESCLGNWCM